MNKRSVVLVVMLFAAETAVAAKSVAELFERVKDAVVVIETQEKGLYQGRWDNQVNYGGIGTGFIVSGTGDILTAAHVVHNADRVIVHMHECGRVLSDRCSDQSRQLGRTHVQ